MFKQRPVSFGAPIPVMGQALRVTVAPRLSQAPALSAAVAEAKKMLDGALSDLRSVEDNLSMLDIMMGPESALQALEEGRESVERAREAYDLALAEESA